MIEANRLQKLFYCGTSVKHDKNKTAKHASCCQ